MGNALIAGLTSDGRLHGCHVTMVVDHQLRRVVTIDDVAVALDGGSTTRDSSHIGTATYL